MQTIKTLPRLTVDRVKNMSLNYKNSVTWSPIIAYLITNNLAMKMTMESL